MASLSSAFIQIKVVEQRSCCGFGWIWWNQRWHMRLIKVKQRLQFNRMVIFQVTCMQWLVNKHTDNEDSHWETFGSKTGEGRYSGCSFIAADSHLNSEAIGDRPTIPASLILLTEIGSHCTDSPRAGPLLVSKQNLLSTLREQQTIMFGFVLTGQPLQVWSEASCTWWIGCLQIRSESVGLYLGLDFIYAAGHYRVVVEYSWLHCSCD